MANAAAYRKLKDENVLPSPAGVALELLRLTSDENVTLAAIARVVESDPALAGRILKLVNSPYAGMSRKIGSLPEAVKLLGLRTVRNLALGLSLISDYREGSCGSFDFGAFWSESLARAVASRQLAAVGTVFPPDEAFAAGLLAKIGRLALAVIEANDRASRPPAAQASQSGPPSAAKPTADDDLSENDLSAEMLADWRLSGLTCEAVRFQDAPEQTPTEPGSPAEQLARLLELAGAMAQVLTVPDPGPDGFTAALTKAAEFGIDEPAFRDLLQSTADQWQDAARIFSVPISDLSGLEALRSDARAVEPTVEEPTDRVRILVVDDDPAMLRLTARQLANAGYRVTTATGALQALDIDRHQAPQIVITDWHMPEIDGLELCRRLRIQEQNGFVYILVLTAESQRSQSVEALQAGADDYLAKPFRAEELLAHVRAAERIVRLQAQLGEHSRETARANAQLAAANERLRTIATTDELTGLANRREGLSRLAECWSLADRHGQPLSCMIADIDHFKQFNDTYGHAAGDAVLKATAVALRASARTGELVCRFGGEEFLVLCPKSPAATAAAGAERLRLAVASVRVPMQGEKLSVTISLGVAERTDAMACSDDLLKAADQMLYAAKAAGRNRIAVAGQAAGMPDPAGPSAPQPIPQRLNSHAGEPGLPIRVLLADDDPQFRALCRRVLDREGHLVFEAADGPEVIEQVAACSPDVIVLDVKMPRMDGLECARRLRSDAATRSIPIIMLSSADDPAGIEAGLEAGADEYVTKPCHWRVFALRVRSMAHLHRKRAELIRINSVRWEQARSLQVLLDLSCALVGEESPERILKRIVRTAADLARCRRVSLMLPDADNARLHIAEAVGVDAQLARNIWVPVGEAISGKVFATGRQIVVNTPEEARSHQNRYESGFFASVPLVSKALHAANRVVGVLNITDRHEQAPFEPAELESLDLLCNLAAAAIDDCLTRRARDCAHDSIVVALATLAEHRDVDTGTHLDRVTRYAALLAEELRNTEPFGTVINEAFLQTLRRSMPLHDIGKVGIPDDILLKPGRLTEAEMEIMKGHADIGARTIRSLRARTPGVDFLRIAEEIAWAHHERWDGRGYPRRLAGGEIPLAARIAAVADVYDALTSRRVYKEAIPHERAARMIRQGAGTQFDPNVVEAFVRREEEFAGICAEFADAPAAHPEPLVAAGGGIAN